MLKEGKAGSAGVLSSDALSGQLGDLLSSLGDQDRENLINNSVLRAVTAGTILLEAGQQSPEIGYVVSGTLAMSQVIDDGRRHIIGLLVPTDVFGRPFQSTSAYRIEALTDTQLLCFEMTFFETVMKNSPEIEQLFLLHIMDELDAAREWLLLISGRKVINRAAALLAILVRRLRPKSHLKAIPVALPLRRQELAHYLGTTPESLSRSFHELAERAILKIVDPQNFLILDLPGLVEISGHDLLLEDDT